MTTKSLASRIFLTVLLYIVCLILAYYVWFFGTGLPLLLIFGGGELNVFAGALLLVGFYGPIVICTIGAYIFVNYIGKKFPLWVRILVAALFMLSFLLPAVPERIRTAKLDHERAIEEERHEGENIRYYDKAKTKIEFIERYKKVDPNIIKQITLYPARTYATKQGIVQDGKQEYYYENGQLEREEYYINGKINGITKSYYEDGFLFSMGEYKNGIPIGTHTSYYSSGQISYSATYKNGEATDVKRFREDGTPGW